MHSDIADVLLDIQAVRYEPDNPKTFKSGIISPVYIDNRSVPFWPDAWNRVIAAFQQQTAAIDFDVIAGIEAAGIPHSAALAFSMQRPSVFVRKQAKEHGLKNRVEGGDVDGQRVLLIEDLVTTGGSSLSGVQALREAGALIEHCLAIVSYGFAEAIDAFAAAGVQLHTLTHFGAILERAGQRGALTSDAIATIQNWLNDPRGWHERH